MRTSLVTREEMIEAIEQHTACISTRDIPGVIANYFMITKQLYRRKDKHAVHRILLTDIREYLLEQGSSELRNRRSRSTQGGTQNESN